jgi:hypothetical protein
MIELGNIKTTTVDNKQKITTEKVPGYMHAVIVKSIMKPNNKETNATPTPFQLHPIDMETPNAKPQHNFKHYLNPGFQLKQ